MNQAEALLNSLTETVVKHTHPVPDSDTHFIIDPYTRQIENTNYQKTVIMRGDHNSERFTFELPRYVDGHDMSLCNRVIVHFDNVGDSIENIYSDVAYMDDLRINPDKPDTVISSWLIRREATQIVGLLSFSLQYQCVEGDEVTYEWNTDSCDEIEIRKSKSNGEAAIIKYTNVLEEWRAKIFGAGDSVMSNITTEGANQVAAVQNESATQQAAIELKGSETLATIPDDYTEVYNMATEAVRTKADGIVCEAEGSAITINDVSNDYIRGLKIYGKTTQRTTNGYQLFDASRIDTVTMNGVRLTNNGDGSFTIGGDSTITDTFAKYYEYSHEETVRLLRAGPLVIKTQQVTNPYVYAQMVVDSAAVGTISNYKTKTEQLEILQEWLDNETAFLRVGFFGKTDAATSKNSIVMPILYQDGDGVWEGFSGGLPAPNPDYPQDIVSMDNLTIKIHGKNLLEFDHSYNYVPEGVATVVEELENGIILRGSDGAVPGGSTYSSGWYQVCYNNRIPLNTGNRVTLSADYTVLENPHATTANISLHFSAKNSYSLNDSVPRPADGVTTRISRTITIEKDDEYFFTIGLNSCLVRIENIQLELSDVDTDYEPYIDSQVINLVNTLHGIPTTTGTNYVQGNYIDENSQEWICDEVDLERRVLVQRLYSRTFDGSDGETIARYAERENVYGFTLKFTDANMEKLAHAAYCTHFENIVTGISSANKECFLCGAGSATIYVLINKERLGEYSVEAFKAWLSENPITVVFKLSTPIETPLTAEEIETFKSIKTNYPNTTILNSSGAWMKAKYNADTKLYISNAAVDGAVSAVEEVLNDTY